MPTKTESNRTDGGFVEALASDNTGHLFGYRLTGARPGPQLVVGGTCPIARKVFDRLLSIPTLPWMSGNLILLHLDALDELNGEFISLGNLGHIDRIVMLPWKSTASDAAYTRQNYRMVLRAAADLGMISGRGVGRAL